MNKNQSGRSMVEMLGVLAIIGVLSIGGIAAYRIAMTKNKINNIMNGLWVEATHIASQIQGGSTSLKTYSDNIEGIEISAHDGWETSGGDPAFAIQLHLEDLTDDSFCKEFRKEASEQIGIATIAGGGSLVLPATASSSCGDGQTYVFFTHDLKSLSNIVPWNNEP